MTLLVLPVTAAIALSTCLYPLVNGHGVVTNFVVDVKSFPGPFPPATMASSPIRSVSSNGPVQPTSNKDLGCGLDAKNAQGVVDVMPGSRIEFHWTDGSIAWFHDVGPILTYLTSCTGNDCTNFDSHGAKWFKIDQVARHGPGQPWWQDDLTKGMPYTITFPQNIAPGQYLIRNEVIALQNGGSVGGAELYPSCTQINVGGNGNGKPQSNELVSFPGAYSDTDPGIHFDPYSNTDATYIFPGPPIASFVGGDNSQPVSGSTGTTSEGQGSSGPSSRVCKLVRSSSSLTTSSSKVQKVLASRRRKRWWGWGI